MMRLPGGGRLSLAAVLVLWGLIALALLRTPPVNILSWDTFGYYLYLPATFIHHDPAIHDIGWVNDAVATYNSTATLYQVQQQPDGAWVLKYPMGLALLWLPFFLAGHLVALLSGAPADGFSAPYQWSIIGACLAYVLVGLMLLRRLLLAHFPDGLSAAVLALLVMGTNYVHQALYSTGMPHVFLFTLYAGVLWHTHRWYQEHRRSDAVKLSVLMGLLALSRPSEAVVVLIPLLYGLSTASWREHVHGLMRYKVQLMLVAGILLLVGAPQLLYWKWLTGKLLYMSYNNPGEGFEFLHPYTWEVLFSFRKGWYIYTPVMAVATAGLFLLRERLPVWRWSLVAFFLLNLYVVSSWSCWWYADSFGQRALVQSYAVMALPLGAVLGRLAERTAIWRWSGAALLLGLTGLNLFQVHQQTLGLIHTSRMTWPAYKAVFGRIQRPEGLEKLWLVERALTMDHGAPDLSGYRSWPLRTMGFDAPEPGVDEAGRTDTIAFDGGHAWLLGPGREFTPAVRVPWRSISSADHVWFEVTCRVHRPLTGPPPKLALVNTFEHNGYSYHYMARDVDLQSAEPGTWVEVRQWYQSPEVRRPEDPLAVYAWLRDTLPAAVDRITIIVHEPRP
jgi:hypothetical protein